MLKKLIALAVATGIASVSFAGTTETPVAPAAPAAAVAAPATPAAPAKTTQKAHKSSKSTVEKQGTASKTEPATAATK